MKTLLADLGFERNADSIRGFVVQAWLVGLLAVISALSLSRSMNSRTSPSLAAEERGTRFMKHTLWLVSRLMLGVGIVVGGVHAMRHFTAPRQSALVISPPSEATVLALGEDGILHVGARSGYYVIDRTNKKTMPSGVESRDLRHTAGLLAQNGDVWIACEQGLYRKRGSSLEQMKARDGGNLGPAFCLMRARDGRLFAGGSECLLRQADDGSWATMGRESAMTLDRVAVLHEDRKGRIWAGSDTPNGRGLMRLDPNQSRFTDVSKGLPHRSVCRIAEDADGELWVATGFAASGGAARWDDAAQAWMPLDGPPGLEGCKIRSLFLDSTGAFWFCSEYDGVAIRRGSEWHQQLYRKGFPCREVKDVIEADGGFWLATERGVLFLDHHPLAPVQPNTRPSSP